MLLLVVAWNLECLLWFMCCYENVSYARKSCHKRLIECKIYCWNARGEIYLNPVFIFITQVSWRAQREIFACAGGAVCSQRCQISVPGARAAV